MVITTSGPWVVPKSKTCLLPLSLDGQGPLKLDWGRLLFHFSIKERKLGELELRPSDPGLL